MHTSDWHIGRFLNSYNLLEDQQYFLDWLFHLLKEEKVDLLIISGDIYNTAAPSSSCVALLDEFFSKVVLNLKKKVLLISGNHDSPEKLGFSSKILEKSDFYISTNIENIKTISFKENSFSVGITLLPYISKSMFKETFKQEEIFDLDNIIEFLHKKYIKKNIVFDFNILCAHGLFLSGQEDLKFCDSEIEIGGVKAFNLSLFKNFSYIALGHLHRAQKAGENARYSGSPLKYSISEANDRKSIFLIDLEKGKNIKIEKIFVEFLRDLRVETKSFRELLEEKSKDYVSVKLTDENFIIDPYNRLKQNFPNLLEIEFLNLKLDFKESFKSLKKMTPEKLFKEFYSFVVNKEMNEKEIKFLKNVISKTEKEN